MELQYQRKQHHSERAYPQDPCEAEGRHWAGVYQNRLGRGLQMERVTHVSLEKAPQESKGCFPGDLVVVSAGRRLYCIQQASGQLHLE